MTACSVDGCEKPARKRSWCYGHYSRIYRTGTLGEGQLKTQAPNHVTLDERLRYIGWDEVNNGCWIWRGKSSDSNGYCLMSWENRSRRVTRCVYETWVGPIPEGHVVRHKCDNPPCMNPDHLETGTHADNANDRESRGRGTLGENQQASKFKASDIPEVRRRLSLGQTHRSIAEDYGVNRTAVSAIHRGLTWKWVP